MKTVLIDNEVLSNLFGGCEDSMMEVFSTYLNTYEESRQNLSSAFLSGNLLSLKRLLHFHGPSFMYLGLPQVAEMFKQLEHKCAHTGNHFVVAEEFSELLKAMEQSYFEILKAAECFKKAV